MQQALLNAYRALRPDEAPPKLRPWLHQICHNSALRLLRARVEGGEPLPEDYGAAEPPEQVLERRERLSEVVTAIEALPARQRHAILLRELEGRTHEEIAAELGTEEGAVRQLIHRARAALREAATAVTPFDVVTRLPARSGFDSMTGRTAELLVGAGGGGAAKVLAVLVTVGATGGMAISEPPAEGSRLPELRQRPPAADAKRGSAELAERRAALGRRGSRGSPVGSSGGRSTEDARDQRGRSGSSGEGSSRSPRSGSDSSGSGSSGGGSSGSGSSGSGSSGSGSSDSRSGSSSTADSFGSRSSSGGSLGGGSSGSGDSSGSESG